MLAVMPQCILTLISISHIAKIQSRLLNRRTWTRQHAMSRSTTTGLWNDHHVKVAVIVLAGSMYLTELVSHPRQTKAEPKRLN